MSVHFVILYPKFFDIKTRIVYITLRSQKKNSSRIHKLQGNILTNTDSIFQTSTISGRTSLYITKWVYILCPKFFDIKTRIVYITVRSQKKKSSRIQKLQDNILTNTDSIYKTL